MVMPGINTLAFPVQVRHVHVAVQQKPVSLR
ncbi:hypothetical protein RHECNPAF_3340014 [Rhizobium etli CNPAF512]|nr:hypothetical protein RHECNPAF_3340014 [Rhizobium etli CNPAF512]